MTAEEAIAGLDEVPWSQLLAVYETAGNIPVAIRTLATSNSDSEIREATALLENELEHQDAITQATVFAVPFFVMLLRVSKLPSKAAVLSLLARFIKSAGYSLDYGDLTPCAPSVAESYRHDQTTLWHGATDCEDAHDHDRFCQEELWAWDFLVVDDIVRSASIFANLASDRCHVVSNEAALLLDAINERTGKY